jgi:ATP phosphoribosyltransferase regulatory subunit
VAIAKKDASAVRLILQKEPVPEAVREEILALPRLFGGCEVLEEAARVVRNERSRTALANLQQVVDILRLHGITDYLTIDLGEIRGLHYHTGLTFEGFVAGLGESVCSGGRYDDLMGRYGCPVPATGFAFNILTLLQGLERRPDVEASKTRDFLLFNLKEDRQDALAIARALRRRGLSVARDIIRRDIAESLAYARRMNILQMIIVGGDGTADDNVVVVRVADGARLTLAKASLLQGDGPLSLTF